MLKYISGVQASVEDRQLEIYFGKYLSQFSILLVPVTLFVL